MQPSYGNRSDKTHLSAADAERIDLARFDEQDPWQHMMKMMFGCGTLCMFRSKEHAFFMVHQVKFGHYPHLFEHPGLAGHPYVTIDNLTDKSHQVSVNNNHARQCSEFLRFPINPSDPGDFGACVQRYMNKLSPGQTRMYCKPASEAYIESTYRRHGNTNSIFYPQTPLGVNKITALMVEGARILGIAHENFRPHALRAVGITNLANDSAVSEAERCRAARHSTVNANRMYQTVDGRSEYNRLRALGVTMPQPIAPPEPPSIQAPIIAPPEPPSVQVARVPQVAHVPQQQEEEEIELIDVSSSAARATHSDVSVSSSTCSDPVLKCHNQKEAVEAAAPAAQSLTQEGLAKLQEKICQLEGLMKGEKRPREEPETSTMSATQIGIQDLEEKIGCLQGLMKLKNDDRKPPALSENQLAIKKLEMKVKDLMDTIEEKELYCESLENDFFGEEKKLRSGVEYQSILYQKRLLERENRELFDYINCDEGRDNRRKFRKF